MACHAAHKKIIPEDYSVLPSVLFVDQLSLAKLILGCNLCGTSSFSMQFIVGAELTRALVLLAVISY